MQSADEFDERSNVADFAQGSQNSRHHWCGDGGAPAIGKRILEAVYQEALELELSARGIPFQRQVALEVRYKEQSLKCAYCADFICFDSIIVEIKALSKLSGIDEAQIINYLKATGLEVGLLINFGAPSLEFRRFIRSNRQAVPE